MCARRWPAPKAGLTGAIPLSLASLAKWLLLLLLIATGGHLQSASAQADGGHQGALFGENPASDVARQLAEWVVRSGDNSGMPFILIDKVDAKVFVFADGGKLIGAAPALLGMAVGDDSVPDIGRRPLATIRPEERTTPAGRYVAALDRNLHGVGILWIDYDLALSLHRVVPGTAREQRGKRLDSPSPLDNRISYGCVNVPVSFYNRVVEPSFRSTNGIVYILPETRSLSATFAGYSPVLMP
jgi:hypothetical protein